MTRRPTTRLWPPAPARPPFAALLSLGLLLGAWLGAWPARAWGAGPPPTSAAVLVPLSPATRALVASFRGRSEEAERKGQNGLAVQLLRAATELEPADLDLSMALADGWNLAFQYDAAVEEYRRALGLPGAEGRRAEIQREIDRLTASDRPLEEGRAGALPLLPDDAKKAFVLGETLRRGHQDGEAIQAYQAAVLLDDALPGPYRALGGEYEKAGDTTRERQFFAHYLAMRSTGAIADDIRRRLAKVGALGTIDVTSSLPCDLWLNDQDLGKKTPLVGFRLPEGPFKITCDLTARLHSSFSQHVTVQAGETRPVLFDVGILHIALDPWPRVMVDGRDVGLYDDTAIRAGHHVIDLVAHDDSRRKQLEIDLAPGQTLSITAW